WHASNLANDHAFETPAFAGWRVNGAVGRGIDATVRYLGERVPPGDPVFVFPDATIVYALAGRESWRPAPFAFHIGNSPPEGRWKDEFLARFREAPPRWIVVHESREVAFADAKLALLWLGLGHLVATRYEPVWSEGDWSIGRLKETASEGTPR